jgi:hypothetical protein
MRRFLLTMAALLAASATASACINDSELPSHEREFRSSYKNSPAPESTPSSSYAAPVAAGGGVLLLIGAAVVTLRTPRV